MSGQARGGGVLERAARFGLFGAEAAARHYYRTSAAQLGPEQAAWLAAIVPNPRFYDRSRSTTWIGRKTRIILSRMRTAEVP